MCFYFLVLCFELVICQLSCAWSQFLSFAMAFSVCFPARILGIFGYCDNVEFCTVVALHTFVWPADIPSSKLVGMSKNLRLVSERHHSFKNISDSISSLSLEKFSSFWSIKHCWNFLSFSVLTIHYYCLVQVFVF